MSSSRTPSSSSIGPTARSSSTRGATTTGAGAAGGALWGGLIGLIFLAPLLGMAVGAATGALGSKVADVGVDDDFMENLGARLRSGARR